MLKLKGRECWWKILLILVGLALLLPIAALLVVRSSTEKAWRNYQAQWNPIDPLDLRHYAPPAIPEEENLAFHPLFKGWETPGSSADLWFRQFEENPALGSGRDKFMADRELLTRSDLSRIGTPAPALSPEERAAELVRLNQPVSALLDQLAQALAERPHAHFAIPWHDALRLLENPSGHILGARGPATNFNLCATLNFHTGDFPGAAADIINALRLTHAIGQDPLLFNLLLEIAMREDCLNTLWDGLSRQKWDEEALAALATELARIAPGGERILTVLRTHRAEVLALIDHFADLSKGSGGSRPTPFVRYFLSVNRLALCRDLQTCLLAPTKGVPAKRATLSGAREFAQRMMNRRKGLKKKLYAPLLLTVLPVVDLTESTLKSEAAVAAARIAVALERHRLAHGSYPGTLAELSPQFLQEIPRDLVNGCDLAYRLKPGGTPLICHRGLDGVDDGGLPGKDIVWQYPPVTP